ncbi:SAM-dependent methyltransferase [Limisphaera ngatamarikiensis]|uniref:SAM-dependent methyltransferase n=2 Tax=Limisphaera ngatamarikiensis TaxID=1324935 RepID=A0A6M1RHB4_9BACT|nr:SAM-dependent methyltransferase [Limisphaera ngatamarikiensis]
MLIRSCGLMSNPATERFCDLVRQSLDDGTFVRLVLRPSASSTETDPPRRIVTRCIELRGQPHLSITAQHARQDRTWNLPLPEALAWLRAELMRTPKTAYLATTTRDWQWMTTSDGPRVVGHPPSQTAPPPRTHDQPHTTWLDESARDWLLALGLVDASGRPKPSAADKYRQIERFLEIAAHQLQHCGWLPATTTAPTAVPGTASPGPASTRTLTVVDAGCGKGYLTFALWHLLTRKAHHPVQLFGIEARPELVRSVQAVADRIGARGLAFVPGDIATVDLPGCDILMALHACNTATDAALLRGIRYGARLLLVAPCCHHQLRPQLRPPPLWQPVLRHGLLAGRFATWLTDALRVLFLEWAGYKVRVVEFIESEHTPMNLLLSAIRVRPPFRDPARRERILQLKETFGIQHHALDPLLNGSPTTDRADASV